MSVSPLANVEIVLVGTKYSGNLGSVARAMHNMGLNRLRLVRPECAVDAEAVRMARQGTRIFEQVRRFRSLPRALKGIRLVVGTTARTGGNRAGCESPRVLAAAILDRARRHRVAILFGPEDTGLVDDDLIVCHRLLRIPTHHRFRSLNVSQAVLIVGYELFLASLRHQPASVPKLAPVEQVESMYAQMEGALRDIGFLHAQNARHIMFTLRRLFGRAGLQASDVAVLRGIARQISWFGTSRSEPRGSAISGGPR